MYSIGATTGPSYPNHNIVMNNPTSRRIRHDFTTYNTDIAHIIPTIVKLQSVKDYLEVTTIGKEKDKRRHT